jgi:hypothetical protein
MVDRDAQACSRNAQRAVGGGDAEICRNGQLCSRTERWAVDCGDYRDGELTEPNEDTAQVCREPAGLDAV